MAAAFVPTDGCPDTERAKSLTFEELEALRLCDMLGMHQSEAAEHLGVSRATIGRTLEDARRKVATALTGGLPIRIEGGTYVMSESRTFGCLSCGHRWVLPYGTGRPSECPSCRSAELRREDLGRRRCCRREGRL